MEWTDPPWVAGHWVPEMVALASGQDVLGQAGAPSIRIEWAQVRAAAPEVVVLMPCGYDLARTLEDRSVVEALPGWRALPAVQTGRVYAVDGSSYFNRPGPRLVDGHLKVNTRNTSTNIVNSAEPQMNRSSSSLFDTF